LTDALIEAARSRLAVEWGRPVGVDTIRVDHHERAVFDTVGPAGNSVVVKVQRSPNRFEREVVALRAAAQCKVMVPGIVFSAAGPPSLLALERIDGPELSELSAQAAWVAAGRELRRLHTVPPPPGLPPLLEQGTSWRSMMLWWANQEWTLAKSQGRYPEAFLGQLYGHMRASFETIDEPPLTMIHGDCRAAHFIMTPTDERVVGILDFGDASIGDPAWDLAVLTIWAPEHLDVVLDGYTPTSSLRSHLADALTGYRIVRHLGAARWLPEHGYDPRDEIAALDQYA
jgi:aminoglycoside phosphotransferase (APT) family kinase protein